jgi:D-alanyl-D-alanine carboxypeptidase
MVNTRIFAQDTRDVIGRAEVEAQNDGTPAIEAEHLLLALAAEPGSATGRLLGEFGLDHEKLASTLREEYRRSLAFVGVAVSDQEQHQAIEPDGSLSLGTSAKAAVKRALVACANRRARLETTDLLLGIVQAGFGTVPRTLEIAGVDRTALVSRAAEAASK